MIKWFKRLKAKMDGIETNFINMVKITQVGDVDYILHLFNTYSNEAWVFKIYKPLFDKGMEIRKVLPFTITTTEDSIEDQNTNPTYI